jgi:L-2-hydroxyglutarate oxidase LhgO
MDRVDVIVIGAGIVGLAAARALARSGHDLLILERAAAIGTGISSRNSEVIHAGLYYTPGSLKARLCVEGAAMLYAYCEERGIAHRRCGKLVVATRAQDDARLLAIEHNARACGVQGLLRLDGAAAREREPALAASTALWSPDSGIVDSHALMLSLLADAEAAGATLALRSPFASARREGCRWTVHTGGDDAFALQARCIVNAAGLSAQAVALSIAGFPSLAIPRRHLAKGHYFSLATKSPFCHLIYPIPADGGLGVHLTLDLAGQARFGPDVQWLDAGIADDAEPDYAVDASRSNTFAAEIRRWWPALPGDALQPAYTGVRPKLSGPGEAAADFRIDGPDAHHCPGIVQLFGIESPGLTACLAIGDRVRAACSETPT